MLKIEEAKESIDFDALFAWYAEACLYRELTGQWMGCPDDVRRIIDRLTTD